MRGQHHRDRAPRHLSERQIVDRDARLLLDERRVLSAPPWGRAAVPPRQCADALVERGLDALLVARFWVSARRCACSPCYLLAVSPLTVPPWLRRHLAVVLHPPPGPRGRGANGEPRSPDARPSALAVAPTVAASGGSVDANPLHVSDPLVLLATPLR